MIKSLVILILISSVTEAAPTTAGAIDRNFEVKANIVSPIYGGLGLDANVAIFDWMAIGPRVVAFGRVVNGSQYSGTSLGLGSVFYIGHKALTHGWYTGAFVDMISLTVPQSNGSGTVTGTEIGVSGGYQWVWASGISLAPGFSTGIYSVPASSNGSNNYYNNNNGNSTTSNLYSGGFFYPEVWIGYSW